MRRIAAALGVATMSLYRHVRGKDDLVLHMIDVAIGEEPFPSEPPQGWRARLELAARLQWGGFAGTPGSHPFCRSRARSSPPTLYGKPSGTCAPWRGPDSGSRTGCT